MTTYVGYYISLADLRARVTAKTVADILDDDVDGVPDDAAVAQVIQDAESKFEGYCRGIYPLADLRAARPNEARRLCLDVAVLMMQERHPEYVRAQVEKKWPRVEAELVSVRRGITRMDVEGSPEPAANQGGFARNGDEDDPELQPQVFNGNNSFGVF